MTRLQTKDAQAAYEMAKQNDGAPGTDGVTFEVIETKGVESFLGQLQEELVQLNDTTVFEKQ